MSATTTDNPVSSTLLRAAQPGSHLDDYEVHLTSGNETGPAPPTNPRPQQLPVANPPGWGTEHRGVPPLRPVDTHLDMSERPWNGNPVGDAFVFTMFTGVFTISVREVSWPTHSPRTHIRLTVVR